MTSTVEHPAGVRTITLDKLDRLGIDDNNRLYWDGKQVVLKSALSLTWFQNACVGLTTLGAVASGVMAIVSWWRP
jgi:hypothetical protein